MRTEPLREVGATLPREHVVHRRVATPTVRPEPGLQQAVGNATFAQLVGFAAGSTDVVVQRCGSIPPDQCPCHADQDDTSGDSSAVRLLQRTAVAGGATPIPAEVVRAASLLGLQRSVGNGAVAALLSSRRTRSGVPQIPVVQRDIGFEFQLRSNKIKTNKNRLFGRKDGKFFHEVKGLELQTESGSFMEFETQHFKKWSELRSQIQAAVDVVNAIKADPKSFPFNQDQRLRREGVLRKGETLEVDVQDPAFVADLQWTEGVQLSQYRSLLTEHERTPASLVTPVLSAADKILADALTANKSVKPSANVENLRGFLQIVLNYVQRGQKVTWDASSADVVKATFRLMMRTSFSSVFRTGLTADEKKLFNDIVKSNAIPNALGIAASDPFFKTGYWGDLGGGLKGLFVGGKVTALAKGGVIHDCTAGAPTPGIDTKQCGRRVAGSNITVGSWLTSIAKSAQDSLSPAARGSGSMGNLTMKSSGPEKQLAVLEVRGSDSKSRQQPASAWVTFADEVFAKAAACRSRPGTGTELVYDGSNPFDPAGCP